MSKADWRRVEMGIEDSLGNWVNNNAFHCHRSCFEKILFVLDLCLMYQLSIYLEGFSRELEF